MSPQPGRVRFDMKAMPMGKEYRNGDLRSRHKKMHSGLVERHMGKELVVGLLVWVSNFFRWKKRPLSFL